MANRASILCSGDSQRLGRPKALLTLGDETFLARLVRLFRRAGVDEVGVVIGGRHRSDLLAEADSLDCEVLINEDPADGPISSVRIALAAGEYRSHLVHPVDIPGIGVDDVGLILRAACARESDMSEVWIPSHEMRRGHPVALSAAMARVVLALPPGSTLRDAWVQPNVLIHHVAGVSRWTRFDVDTPADFERLQAAHPASGE